MQHWSAIIGKTTIAVLSVHAYTISATAATAAAAVAVCVLRFST